MIISGKPVKLPTESMEDFIKQGKNKSNVFPDKPMELLFDRVIAASQRDFLNANIHFPGMIKVTPTSLEAIAVGGMYGLIQGIIDSL